MNNCKSANLGKNLSHMLIKWGLFVFLITLSAICKCQENTHHVLFNLNSYSLSEVQSVSLDSFLQKTDLSKGNLLIVGYTDEPGTESANNGLSYRRAKTVESYVLSKALPREKIKLCIGKGEIRDSITRNSGNREHRKVDVMVVSDTTLNEYLENVQIGKTVILQNVYFLPNRHVITENSKSGLEYLYSFLLHHPGTTIRIEGHVCCIPSGKDAVDTDTPLDIYEGDPNLKFYRNYPRYCLSKNRARAIYDYLLSKGIDSSRLSYTGYGSSNPLIKHPQSENDNAKNRRVEIRILTR
jgi:outer membrane protein OmpA-like peptidoglycan-associated protein